MMTTRTWSLCSDLDGVGTAMITSRVMSVPSSAHSRRVANPSRSPRQADFADPLLTVPLRAGGPPAGREPRAAAPTVAGPPGPARGAGEPGHGHRRRRCPQGSGGDRAHPRVDVQVIPHL